MAISIFVGRDPDDVAELKGQIESLNDDRSTLIARLRGAQHKHLLNRIVDKLSVFVGREPLAKIGKVKLNEEMQRWIPAAKTVDFSDEPPRNFEDFENDK